MDILKETTEALKKSPLFNLSLASKELFHSNFWAWLMETESMTETAKLILRALVERTDFDWKTVIVEREKNNFDLTLTLTDLDGKAHQIVIENKIKSIPTSTQLDRYSGKLAKDAKGVGSPSAFLLSLTKPGFFTGNFYFPSEGPKWRYFSYEELLGCLSKGTGEIPYHDELLKDYQFFIQNLIALRKSIHEIFKQKPESLINPFDWPGENQASLYSALKQIRMHDVFEKWRMIELKAQLEAKMNSECPQLLKRITFSPGFTRGTGILDVSPKEEPAGPFLKVQLQGKQIRQVLEIRKPVGRKLFAQAKELLEAEKWFKAKNDTPLPECGEKENHHFCKYGNVFVYRHESLKDIKRVYELVCELSRAEYPVI